MANKIRELRKARGITMKELGYLLGVSESAVSHWESGRRHMDNEMLFKLSDFFGVSVGYLLGVESEPTASVIDSRTVPEDFEPLANLSPVPLVGQIACGTPITAEENVECMVNVPSMWHADFALTCKGDSMYPTVQDGDLVAIRSQPQVDNGDIAAVLIDGEATLKRVYCYPDHMLLQAENSAFDPIILIGAQMSTVLIEGKAVGFCRGL